MTVATLFGAQMAQLTGNAGGVVQSLPGVNLVGGRQRSFVETVTLASQAANSVIGVARLPLYATFLGIELVSTVSLGSATLAFGDANNPTLYAPATTLTVTTPVPIGSAAAFAPILVGYDSVTGNQVTPFMPQKAGEGGAMYEDIVMTVGAAALPASGSLVIITNYMLD